MALIIVMIGAFAVWLLLLALIPLLRRGLLDQPNSRSSHSRPTPRGGGVAFVLVAVAASVISWSFGLTGPGALLPLIVLPLALVGLLDDRLDLPMGWRYGVQLVTACLLLVCSPLVHGLLGVWLLFLPVLLIAVTAVTNFINFMDGLDGLVAGCMAVALIAAGLRMQAGLSIWALVGGLLGFLIWNWSPARVFMGDVGSTFLGALFAGLVLQAPSWTDSLALLLVATPLLGDACWCVTRRILGGQPIFKAHRLHLYQRLHQAGWTHARISSLYIVAMAVLALALMLGGLGSVLMIALIQILMGIWLDRNVALPFSLASGASDG
jgi:Fuc2NAc and GlcNAc transferase